MKRFKPSLVDGQRDKVTIHSGSEYEPGVADDE
jgi:hypothetical protein